MAERTRQIELTDDERTCLQRALCERIERLETEHEKWGYDEPSADNKRVAEANRELLRKLDTAYLDLNGS